MQINDKLMELCFPEGMIESMEMQHHLPPMFMYLLPASTCAALKSTIADVMIQESAGPSMCFFFLQCDCREEMTITSQNKEDGILFLLAIHGDPRGTMLGRCSFLSYPKIQCGFLPCLSDPSL